MVLKNTNLRVCFWKMCILWHDWLLHGEQLHWISISKNNHQWHDVCNRSCISSSEFQYCPVYWNSEWYTWTGISHALLYNGQLQHCFLTHELHQPTEKILDDMYSNYLLSMIVKPTRETITTVQTASSLNRSSMIIFFNSYLLLISRIITGYSIYLTNVLQI